MALQSFDGTVPASTLHTALADDGMVIVEGVLDASLLAGLHTALTPLLLDAARGDNPFDGFETRRIFDPLARTRVLDEVVLHPIVHSVVSDFLRWPYQLGMTIVSEVLPGERAQRLHRDSAVYPLPPDFPDVMVNTVWALDDFTADNGATLVAPGSHRDPDARAVVPAVMGAGSVLIYVGRLLHGAGPNLSDASRVGLIVEHVVRWLRPAECHPAAIGAPLAATLSVSLQELLGFNQTSEFFGFIAGQSPSEWLAAQRPDGNAAERST